MNEKLTYSKEFLDLAGVSEDEFIVSANFLHYYLRSYFSKNFGERFISDDSVEKIQKVVILGKLFKKIAGLLGFNAYLKLFSDKGRLDHNIFVARLADFFIRKNFVVEFEPEQGAADLFVLNDPHFLLIECKAMNHSPQYTEVLNFHQEVLKILEKKIKVSEDLEVHLNGTLSNFSPIEVVNNVVAFSKNQIGNDEKYVFKLFSLPSDYSSWGGLVKSSSTTVWEGDLPLVVPKSSYYFKTGIISLLGPPVKDVPKLKSLLKNSNDQFLSNSLPKILAIDMSNYSSDKSESISKIFKDEFNELNSGLTGVLVYYRYFKNKDWYLRYQPVSNPSSAHKTNFW